MASSEQGRRTTMMKKACLVYVASTAALIAEARARLEAEGYDVSEILANLDDVIAAEVGEPVLPESLKDCVNGADLCVFLLPEDAADDGCLGAGGSYASELGIPFIAVMVGGRDTLPPSFDADAAGVVRDCGNGLVNAIQGDPSFKNPDGSPASPRKTDHIKCQ